MPPSRTIDIALAIAATGLPVFPCAASKRPAIASRDGGHGFQDASTDPARIRDLFARANGAATLVGVPTGRASGLDVLDLDYRAGAAPWEDAHGIELPFTRAHRTRSGGKHLLFRHTPGVTNLASKFAPGVDVRGDGGYYIAPNSPGYAVICDEKPTEWPDWLLKLVLRPAPTPPPPPPSIAISSRRLHAYIATVIASVRAAPDGQKHYRLRNASLALGGVAISAGLDDRTIINLLLSALPPSVADWKTAADTAAWGVANGRTRPFGLADREQ